MINTTRPAAHLADVADDGEAGGGDRRAAKKGEVGHAHAQGGGDRQRAEVDRPPVHRGELVGLRRQRDDARDERGPEVGVEDAPPVGLDGGGVDGELDVELVEAKDHVPDANPHVAVHLKLGVEVHVPGAGERRAGRVRHGAGESR